MLKLQKKKPTGPLECKKNDFFSIKKIRIKNVNKNHHRTVSGVAAEVVDGQMTVMGRAGMEVTAGRGNC